MAYTPSRRKAAVPASTDPSLSTTPTRQELPLQTTGPLALRLKRTQSRDFDDSPVPLKLRKKSIAPLETFRTRTQLSKPDSESDLKSRRSQSPAGPDAAIIEEDESKDEQHPTYAHVHRPFKHDVVAKDVSNANQHTSLQYFQDFPHDPRSTLCVEHFLSLAEKWYWNYRPTAQSQLMAIPRDAMTRPDFSTLALPVCEETWAIKNFQSFKDELSEKITNTKSAYIKEYYRVAQLTGCKPKCEIFDASAFTHCSMCAQSPGFQPPADGIHDTCLDMQSFEEFIANDDRMIREMLDERKNMDLESPHIECEHHTSVTILGTDEKSSYTECEDCGHRREVSLSRLRTRKYAIEIGSVRFAVKIAPTTRMTMNSKVMNIDVGGIHIVVDHCNSPLSLIRFRSTHFSQTHEKDDFDYHDQGEIEVFGMSESDDV